LGTHPDEPPLARLRAAVRPGCATQPGLRRRGPGGGRARPALLAIFHCGVPGADYPRRPDRVGRHERWLGFIKVLFYIKTPSIVRWRCGVMAALLAEEHAIHS